MLPNPLVLYGAGAAILIAAVGGYKVRDWQCDAAYAAAIEKAAKKEREMRDALEEKGRDFEAAKDTADGLGAARATDIRMVYREVAAPPSDCAVPSDVVRLLQGGVDSANAAASGEPRD
jgi:hypothetical protein